MKKQYGLFFALLSLMLLIPAVASGSCVEGDCLNGTGTFTYHLGQKYTGEWQNGEKHGQGTYVYSDGSSYSGGWREGKRHGWGVETYPDGSRYEGEFADGRPNGVGIFFYNSGRKVAGEFSNGRLARRMNYEEAAAQRLIAVEKQEAVESVVDLHPDAVVRESPGSGTLVNAPDNTESPRESSGTVEGAPEPVPAVADEDGERPADVAVRGEETSAGREQVEPAASAVPLPVNIQPDEQSGVKSRVVGSPMVEPQGMKREVEETLAAGGGTRGSGPLGDPDAQPGRILTRKVVEPQAMKLEIEETLAVGQRKAPVAPPVAKPVERKDAPATTDVTGLVGKGKVETMKFPDGSRYTGEFKDGVPHGHGVATYLFGEKYEGEFKNGMPDGQGIFTYSDGSEYEGEFSNGVPEGQGCFNYASGERYTGEVRNGERNGQGTTLYLDGSTYTGSWKDNEFDGLGTFTRVDGYRYEGEWRAGRKHGQGTLVYPDGRTYAGEFKRGKPNGQGTLTYPDGRIVRGFFKNGRHIADQ